LVAYNALILNFFPLMRRFTPLISIILFLQLYLEFVFDKNGYALNYKSSIGTI